MANDNIKINVAAAEGNIQTLNKNFQNLEAAFNELDTMVLKGGLDHWEGDAKDTFMQLYTEISPKLHACAEFTSDQARVMTEVKNAFESIRISK